MGYCRRTRVIFSVFLFVLTSFTYANQKDLYNLLVEDLLNACSFGYKGTCLETCEVNFSNYSGIDGYVTTAIESNFYIQSEKGFFKVTNNKNEVFFTRNGEFIKRGDEYFLAYGNYKLETKIEECSNNSRNKKTLIFHPTESSEVKRNGYLFSFSDVESFEEEIIPNRLELPNIDPIRILLKMKLILNKSSEEYLIQLELVNRMLDVLVDDKMHQYYIQRNYSQFDLEKYQLVNGQVTLDYLNFIYSTNWARTFKHYIEMLFI